MLEKDVRDFFFKTKENYNLIAGQKELNIDGLRIDIFAVDKQGVPFIIEFKKDKNRYIIGQSAQYLAQVQSMRHNIEKKINYYNINWENLKVLCIAKSFDQRDLNALNYEPIKNRVFLYQYSVIPDYRKKAVFGIDLIHTGEKDSSPLYIPPRQTNELDFKENFDKLVSLEGKENRKQYYTHTILPFLNNVSEKLNIKYSSKGFCSHISYFLNGPHILLRLGIDKKQTHRASLKIHFGEDYIVSGFDMTHALQDATKLQSVIKTNATRIASRILTLTDYSLYVPNTGIAEVLSIDNMNLKGVKLMLQNYTPKKMKECYFTIDRTYEERIMTEKDILNLFDTEYNTFTFLLDAIKNSN